MSGRGGQPAGAPSEPRGCEAAAALGVVVAPSGDRSGTADTEALNAAWTSLRARPGTLRLVAGTYRLRAGELSTFGPGQSLIGAGKGQTIIEVVGSGTALRAFDPATWAGVSSTTGGPRIAGTFTGFTLDGSAAGAGAVGMHMGDFLGLGVHDVQVRDFGGPGAIGLWMDCVVTWAERCSVEVELVNNTDNVVFDSHISGQEYPDASYGYSHFAFVVTAHPGQGGVVIRNGCAFVGCDLTVRGNFHSGESNTGVAFAVGGPEEGAAHLMACRVDCQVEANGRGVTHQALTVSAGSGVGNCQGVLNFLAGNGVAFTDARVEGTLSFTGTVLCPGLGSMAWPQAARHLGAVTGAVTRSLPVWASAGNYAWVALASGANTFGWGDDANDLRGQAGTWELIFVQPDTGGAATVAWPDDWRWAAGGPPQLSLGAGAIDWIRVLTPDFRSFVAEHVGADHARASGLARLADGSATVRDANVTAETIVRHNRQSAGGVLGELSVVLIPGRGFALNSSSATDVSAVHWEIVGY